DHRPCGALYQRIGLSIGLDPSDLPDHPIQRGRHQLMHRRRVVPLDEIWRVAITAEKLLELFFRDARQHCRIGDLVTVEMQYGEDRAIRGGIEEFIGVPARSQGARFRLAIADDASDNQIWIVESGAESVREGIAELAALMNGAGSFRRDVTRDPARK